MVRMDWGLMVAFWRSMANGWLGGSAVHLSKWARLPCGTRISDVELASDSMSSYVYMVDQTALAAFIGMTSTLGPVANLLCKWATWSRGVACPVQFYAEPTIEMSPLPLHYIRAEGSGRRAGAVKPGVVPHMLTGYARAFMLVITACVMSPAAVLASDFGKNQLAKLGATLQGLWSEC